MKRLLLGLALVAWPLAETAAEPQTYASPDAAVAAVIEALHARDRDGLLAVFGPEAEDLVFTGEPAQDREIWGGFLENYNALHRIAVDRDGNRATLYVGRQQWPFPARLARTAAGAWAFDAESAREEVYIRRIGRNELDAIELLHAYVEVQADYRLADYDGDGVMEFAAGILSSADGRDGLYWPQEPGSPESPVGDFFALAAADGYAIDGEEQEPQPYHGYVFRVLQAQGANAPGGEMSYLVNGNMVAGHAMLAYPAEYGETGLASFMVGENGVLYEADLGPETAAVAAAIEAFDPGEGWSILDEAEIADAGER